MAVAVVAIITSTAELADAFFIRGLEETLSPESFRESPVPFFHYFNRFSLASALVAAALTPFFLIGGIQAFRHRESGRKMLAGAFAIRTVWYTGCLVFWLYHLILFGGRPDLLPPFLAWGGLAAIIVSGGIGALFVVVLNSESTRRSFAAHRGEEFETTIVPQR